jgi:hypothetical protein
MVKGEKMKHILLILIAVPTLVFANFLSEKGHNSGSPVVYSTMDRCEKAEKEACFAMLDGYSAFYYELKNGKFKEIKALKDAHIAAKLAKKAAKNASHSATKSYNCETLSGFVKLLCEREK